MNQTIAHIVVNLMAQELINTKQGIRWFQNLNPLERSTTLMDLVEFCKQSHVVGKDAGSAVETCGIKPTFTPCSLLKKAANEDPEGEMILRRILDKIADLPSYESEKSFIVLTKLLSIGEKKRRNQTGKAPERYWRHQDLTDHDILKKILNDDIILFPFWIFSDVP